MRNAFAQEMVELAGRRADLVLLSGDIGNRLFDRFKDSSPGRFLNCGIAEANMIGVAAGLSSCGLRPVCYTIAPFLTLRVMEQIRVDLAYHHLPAVLVGAGAGLSYASLGATHHSLEEMGMLRLIPGLAVLAPGDKYELRAMLRAAFDWPGPVYLRIGKKGEPDVHSRIPSFSIGRSIPVRPGGRVRLLAIGNILPAAVAAADILGARGIACGVVSMASLKPLDTGVLAESFESATLVATLEEHSILGGLSTAVAEWLAQQTPGPRAKWLRFGTPDEFLHATSTESSARAGYGLTAEAIAENILSQWP
jgi:transketolase